MKELFRDKIKNIKIQMACVAGVLLWIMVFSQIAVTYMCEKHIYN